VADPMKMILISPTYNIAPSMSIFIILSEVENTLRELDKTESERKLIEHRLSGGTFNKLKFNQNFVRLDKSGLNPYSGRLGTAFKHSEINQLDNKAFGEQEHDSFIESKLTEYESALGPGLGQTQWIYKVPFVNTRTGRFFQIPRPWSYENPSDFSKNNSSFPYFERKEKEKSVRVRKNDKNPN